ncbi:MAG: CDP-alcohol phosphatidyltransferase family protein [Rhodothermales bacterium]|nr:CDP-alcohol phosphatidyltransferase family protein [Rhodothermales bacterium]
MNDTERLERWNFFHAIALLAAGVAAFAADRTLVTALVAAVSFVVLVVACRDSWTPTGRFGPANGLTTLRLVISLAAAVSADFLAPHPVYVLVWLAVFALDGLDGYIARGHGETSLFGEYFDKESDALFVLLLGFSLYVQGLLGPWVLIAGTMRYVFVLAMHFAPVEGPQREYKSSWARYIYTGCILSFIAVYVLPPLPAKVLALAGTVALVYSFLRYFHWLYADRSVHGASVR